MTERDKRLWQQDIEYIKELKQYIRDLKRHITTMELLQVETSKEIWELKERIANAIDRLEALIVFWKKFNPIDNTMQVEQFKGVIEILKEV